MKKERSLLIITSEKKKRYILLAALITAAIIICCSCFEQDNNVENIEESMTEYQEQWLSTGHWQQYSEIICEYAKQYNIEVISAEQNGYYDMNKGIICDLDGDGIAPELLRIKKKENGCSLEIAYIKNDGAMSVGQVSHLDINGGEVVKIIMNKQNTSGVWDILLEKILEGEKHTSFYRYENKNCFYCGTVFGTLERQNKETDIEGCYDYYGIYLIRENDTFAGYVRMQEYEIKENTKELIQRIPTYIKKLDKLEGYWEITDAKYLQIEDINTVYQIDFTKELEFVNKQVLPIGLLKYDGQYYFLIESKQGEMGYIQTNDLSVAE